MKRFISLLLVVFMLLIATACGSGEDDTPNTTTSGNSEANTSASEATTTEEPVPENMRDDLGEYNFNGATYTILSRKNTSYEFKSEEVTGDLVKDAVYQRNVDIEDRFAVKLDTLEQAGDWGDRDSFIAKIGNSYLSGGHEFDLISTHSAYIVNIGIKGYAYDLAELPNIDLSKRWWAPAYTNNVNIDGAIYSAIGDINYTLYQFMHCMFFNKEIAESNKITGLYELVQDGKWTFDKMKEYSLIVGTDLDGNGVYDKNDLYGIGMNGHACRIFATAFDTKMTIDDGTGHQKVNLPNEKYLDVYSKLYDFVWNNTQVNFQNDADTQMPMFADGKLMFFVGRLGNAATIKDMDDDYGILPLPKYNEEQENYISGARDYMSAIAVFRNTEDPERTGTITEALCMYGYNKVTPAYYETTLKLKYLNDETAMSMLDTIRDTLTFDFAMSYTNSLSLIFSIMGDNIQTQVPSIAAKLNASTKVWQKAIEKLYEDYAKLK